MEVVYSLQTFWRIRIKARHYCKRIDGDPLRCAIFDGDTEDANLISAEYEI